MGWLIEDPKAAENLAKRIKEFQNGIYQDFRVQFDKNPFSLSFWLRKEGKDVARFTLKQMINCCGILVSTDAYVDPLYRKQGIAQELMLLKEALAKEYGYSSMLATVNMTGNPAEVHILEKHGWRMVNDFKNSRTKNQVGVFVKNL